jgi:hypothetical protein
VARDPAGNGDARACDQPPRIQIDGSRGDVVPALTFVFTFMVRTPVRRGSRGRRGSRTGLSAFRKCRATGGWQGAGTAAGAAPGLVGAGCAGGVGPGSSRQEALRQAGRAARGVAVKQRTGKPDRSAQRRSQRRRGELSPESARCCRRGTASTDACGTSCGRANPRTGCPQRPCRWTSRRPNPGDHLHSTPPSGRSTRPEGRSLLGAARFSDAAASPRSHDPARSARGVAPGSRFCRPFGASSEPSSGKSHAQLRSAGQPRTFTKRSRRKSPARTCVGSSGKSDARTVRLGAPTDMATCLRWQRGLDWAEQPLVVVAAQQAGQR